jgi:hypothetical protein
MNTITNQLIYLISLAYLRLLDDEGVFSFSVAALFLFSFTFKFLIPFASPAIDAATTGTCFSRVTIFSRTAKTSARIPSAFVASVGKLICGIVQLRAKRRIKMPLGPPFRNSNHSQGSSGRIRMGGETLDNAHSAWRAFGRRDRYQTSSDSRNGVIGVTPEGTL